MDDKDKLRKEFILKNPKLNATETLTELRKIGLGKRKTDFLKDFRNIRNLPEPTKAKREASIPTKYKPTPRKKPTIQKKLPIPFAKTKFGKIVKDLQKKHGINEKRAIIRARLLLKIPRIDYDQLEQIDYDILIHYGY